MTGLDCEPSLEIVKSYSLEKDSGEVEVMFWVSNVDSKIILSFKVEYEDKGRKLF